MTSPGPKAAIALAAMMLAAGCGSTASPSSASQATAARQVSAVQLSPATSLASPGGGTWATIPMGGTGPNLFWQLFALSAASGHWTLATPPAVATNGALILAAPDGAGPGARALVVGIRPSLYLSFSPVISTGDGGRHWATTPPEPGLAGVPDALAAAPDGQMIALDRDQRVSHTSTASAAWSTLTSRAAVAGTPAGRECALTALTAVAWTQAGTPLLGGTCGRAATTGIFAFSSGTWHLAGPALPAAMAGTRVQVLRLTRTGSTDTTLLEAGSGASAALVTAWTSDGASQWTVSPALPLDGASPVSASTGTAGAIAVVLSGGRGEILDGPHASWQQLPLLPPARTITLAVLAGGTAEALAADGSTLTVWRLATGPARWSQLQVIKVPIQYGSSS
jgi:hypothetical protein